MTRPVFQLIVAMAVMLAGAWMVGWWAFGLVLFIFGAAFGVDAVLRDDTRRASKNQPSNEVLERWRRAR